MIANTSNENTNNNNNLRNHIYNNINNADEFDLDKHNIASGCEASTWDNEVTLGYNYLHVNLE